jgi:hypothetical protein
MTPDTLKMTTLGPRTPQPLRVTVKDGEQLLTDQVISDLMGKDVAARFKMITENAADIGDLDVSCWDLEIWSARRRDLPQQQPQLGAGRRCPRDHRRAGRGKSLAYTARGLARCMKH